MKKAYALDRAGLWHRAVRTYPNEADTACGEERIEAHVFFAVEKFSEISKNDPAARLCVACGRVNVEPRGPEPFHPRHCGFAINNICPDPKCPKKGPDLDVLRVPVPYHESLPATNGLPVEVFMRKRKAHPGLGLIWWEWVSY